MADIIYHDSWKQMAEKKINLSTDTIKCALLNDHTPNRDHDDWTDVSADELSGGNGYTAGGATCANVAVTDDDTNDLVKVDMDDITWNASGGSIGPATHAVFYDDSTSPKYLLYCMDFGGAKTAVSGKHLKIILDAAGLYTIKQQ